ncbi:MAG: HNH endonuclease [Ramlibacter sp.]|nr:HNH endonuclease [Ramlibacter sp.]
MTSKSQWHSLERKQGVAPNIRKAILARDDFTCVSCGHRAEKWMHIHHLQESGSDDPTNLCTLCPACHAVIHVGLNLQLRKVEIWKSPISQVEIVRRTRDGIREGLTLSQINATFGLKKGKRAPNSIEWANSLLREMGSQLRAELPEPLCAVFVDFKQWQIES